MGWEPYLFYKSAGNDFKAHCQHYKREKRGRAFLHDLALYIRAAMSSR